MSPRDPNPGFDSVVAEAAALQEQLPWLRLVCVGGTAAALHAHHRFSTDADQVSPQVSEQFEEMKVALENWEGWKTNRVRHPLALLGERHGIQLGVRQQRRRFPLDTTRIRDLWVPTAEETLRIKAWMVADRGATRDFLDVAALGDLLGPDRTAQALAPMSSRYDTIGTETATMRFAQAAMSAPVDATEVDLRTYRGLIEPYQDLAYVRARVQEIALGAMEQELRGPEGEPPSMPSPASSNNPNPRRTQ